jgi:hypothetical protein
VADFVAVDVDLSIVGWCVGQWLGRISGGGAGVGKAANPVFSFW